jgi:hypothetical protein
MRARRSVPTMDPRATVDHAETVRGVLVILGPRSRARLGLMLQGLGLSEAEADAVLAHGLTWGLFEADPADRTVLRAIPAPRG